MKKTTAGLLLVLNVASFVLSGMCTVYVGLCELMGYPAGEAMPERMYIPPDNDGVMAVLWISVTVMIVTYCVRKKWFYRRAR